jgi:AraC-like DNA-binding protein
MLEPSWPLVFTQKMPILSSRNVITKVKVLFPVHADMVGLIRGLVESLQPFARAHEVSLSFECCHKLLEALYQPEQITQDVTQLICRVITFTPQKYAVKVQLQKGPAPENCLEVIVQNSGVNLALMGDIRSGIKHRVSVQAQDRGSRFSLLIPIDLEEEELTASPTSIKHTIIKPWYNEIRRRLTHHFSDPKNLEQVVRQRNPQEGIFLKKVNAIINNHLDKEGFNTGDLALYMALSRTQLFRKIKELTQMAPGQYIRYVRLRKAKELLQEGELNVSEVGYRVGFLSNSHFCRAFQRQFGVNPSRIK